MLRAALVVATTVVFLSPSAAAQSPASAPERQPRERDPRPIPRPRSRDDDRSATSEESDPSPSCGQVQSTVWYRIPDAPGGRIVLRLQANGDLDGIVAVYESRRSQLLQVICAPTDRRGSAQFVFAGKEGTTYFILFGRLRNSVDGTFTMRVNDTRPDVEAAGHSDCRREGVRAARSIRSSSRTRRGRPGCRRERRTRSTSSRSEVNALHTRALSSRHVQLRGRRIGAAARVRRIRDVHARAEAGRPIQHLRADPWYSVGEAESTASRSLPRGRTTSGRAFRSQTSRHGRGSLDASRINVVNFFHFEVELSSDVTLRLRSSGRFDLVLLSETGRRIDCEC